MKTDYEKQAVLKVLESYADRQVNLDSEAARNMVMEDILEELHKSYRDRLNEFGIELVEDSNE